MIPALMTDKPTPGRERTDEADVSLARLYVLRAIYLSWAVGGIFMAIPPILDPALGDRGLLTSMFGGLWVMGLLGLRYPLQVLPILIFEFVTKTIWLFAFGLPGWLAGNASSQLNEDLLSIGNGPILFGLVIPWGYAYRRFIKEPGSRWR